MSGLSREVIKWIQSLDLSYSVKNVKRDFANGFLIAEMISRYHTSDINMHSFDTGVGQNTKLDNWAQLERYFKKKNIPVSRQMIDDLISSKPNSAKPIVEAIYTFLTDRTVKQVKPVHPPALNVPNFAKPTISQINKDDGRNQPLHIPTSLQAPTTSKNQKILKTKQRVDSSMDEIRIKKNPSSVAQSRAAFSSNPASSHMSRRPVAMLSIMEELNNIVKTELEDDDIFKTFNQRKDLIVSFIERIYEIPEKPRNLIFSAIRERMGFFGDGMINQPKEFWKFMTIMNQGFILPFEDENAGPVFEQFTSLFATLGEALLQKDINSAWELFQDFALDKLLQLIKEYPTKRQQLVKLIYSFCANDVTVHQNVIRILKEKSMDELTFTQCLSVLVSREEQFSEELLEVYVHYATMGMRSSSPALRALSMSVLPTIAEHSPDLIFKLWPKLTASLTDDWWDVHAQILVICSQLLYNTQVDRASTIYNLIGQVLERDHNPNIRTIMLSYMAPHLHNHPMLVDTYTLVLLQLSEEERVSLLEQPSDVVDILQIGSSCAYNIISIPFSWHSIAVAQSLSAYVGSQELENYEIQHYDIMNASVSTVANSGTRNDKEYSEWVQVFQENQNYLFVGLCDDDLCEMASNLLLKFFKLLREDALRSMPNLLRSVEVIYRQSAKRSTSSQSHAHTRCQEVMPEFLISLYDLGEPFVESLRKMRLSLIEQNMESTPLVEFLDHVVANH